MLKEKLGKLLQSYERETETILNEIKKIETNEQYSFEYKLELTRKQRDEIPAQNTRLLNGMLAVINEEVAAASVNPIRKSNDFEAKLSNALSFINQMGDSLTDQTAYELVKPFFGDYQTMHNLYIVLSNKDVKRELSTTRYTLGLLDSVINCANELKSLVESQCRQNSFEIISGLSLAIFQNLLLKQVETVEAKIKELNALTSLEYADVEKTLLIIYNQIYPNSNLSDVEKIKEITVILENQQKQKNGNESGFFATV